MRRNEATKFHKKKYLCSKKSICIFTALSKTKYLYHNSDITKEVLRELVNELPSQLKDVSMKTYSRIKLEGKLENETYVIKRGWAKGYSVEALADLTGLSVFKVKEVIKNIEQESTQTSESNKDKN